MSEQNEIVETCLGFLLKGQSALMNVSNCGKLVITPLMDNGRPCLGIGLEERGYVVHYLDEELDNFVLASAGFPWHISFAVATLVSELVEAGRAKAKKPSARTLTTGDSPQRKTNT